MIWITYLTDEVISIFISDKHSHIRRDQPTGVNQDVSVPAVLEDYPPLCRSKQPRWQAFQEVNHPQKDCQEPITAARSMYLCCKYYTPPLALCSSLVFDRNYSIVYLREVFIGYFLLAFCWLCVFVSGKTTTAEQRLLVSFHIYYKNLRNKQIN